MSPLTMYSEVELVTIVPQDYSSSNEDQDDHNTDNMTGNEI